jgi:hypothetical protein
VAKGLSAEFRSERIGAMLPLATASISVTVGNLRELRFPLKTWLAAQL